MPFSKTALAAAIEAKLNDLRSNENDPAAAAQELAQTIADEVAAQVQAMFADIAVVPVLANGAGPVTGTITMSITVT